LASRSPATDRSVNKDQTEKAGGLTVLTKEEPVTEVTLEVVERGIADEVAILAVLERAIGPAGAIEGVVLHGKNVHDGGNEVPQEFPEGLIPACTAKQPQTCKQEKSGDLVIKHVFGTRACSHVTLHIQTYRRGRRGGTDQVAAVEAVKRAIASRP
jgi:hypothetical protein